MQHTLNCWHSNLAPTADYETCYIAQKLAENNLREVI